MRPVDNRSADFRERVPTESTRRRLLIPTLRLIRTVTCCHFRDSNKASPPGRTIDVFVLCTDLPYIHAGPFGIHHERYQCQPH